MSKPRVVIVYRRATAAERSERILERARDRSERATFLGRSVRFHLQAAKHARRRQVDAQRAAARLVRDAANVRRMSARRGRR